MHRFSTAFISIVAVATGCSLFNREGPSVTCADLQGGSVNACKDGIVASCAGGAISYKVCDEKSVCEGAWQTAGQFRCSQTDPVPGASSGGGTSSGGPGRTSSGGPGGTSSGAPVGVDGGSCGPADTCVIASGSIGAITLDGPNVLFTDCAAVSALRSVPRGGGIASTIASIKGCAITELFVDDSDVYLLDDVIVRSPKAGGPTAAVLAPNELAASSFAIDATKVYWLTNYRELKAIPKVGGSSMTLAKGLSMDSDTHLRIDSGFAYWASGGTLYRVATNVTSPTVPSTVPITTNDSATSLAVDGTIAFAGTNSGAIWSVSLTTGGATKVVDQVGGVRAIAIDSTSIYWVSSKGVGEATRAGDSPKAFTTTNSFYHPGLAADGTYVFFSGAAGLMRGPK